MKGIIAILIVLFTFNLQSQHPNQNEIDSLLIIANSSEADTTIFQTYRKLFKFYFRRDLKQAKEYLDLEIEYAKKTELENYLMLSKVHEGIYYGMTKDHQKSLELFTEIKDYYKKIGNRAKYGGALSNISTCHLNLGNYKLGLEHQMEALKIDEELGVEGIPLGKNYFTIGNIHRMSENPIVSNEWFEKALIEYQKDGSELYSSHVYFTLGSNYLRMDSLEKAEPMLLKAANYFRKINDPNSLSILTSGLASCAIFKKDYDGAMKLCEESLELSKTVGDFNQEMEILSRMGQVHYLRKEYPQSVSCHKRSLAKAKELGLKAHEVMYLEELSSAYGKVKDYRLAYQTLQSYNILNDSMQEENNLAALAEIETKYQTEKKEQEILLLEEKAKRNSLEKKGMIGGILGLLGLCGALIYAMRLKATKNKLAKEKVDQKLTFSKKELEFSHKELELKKQELTAYALQLAHKNEVLEDIKTNVSDAQNQKDNNRSLQQVINKIHFNQNDDDSWEGFRTRFLAVHSGFETKVKQSFPKVSSNELRLIILLKMNLTSKEIANILNVTAGGIKKARYRLRKKLGLETGSSLEDLVLSL